MVRRVEADWELGIMLFWFAVILKRRYAGGEIDRRLFFCE